MSAEPVFFDTNILIYAFVSNDPRNLPARQLLVQGGKVSVQVLNEFCAVARRKLGFDWPRVEAALGLVRELCGAPLPLDGESHDLARALAQQHDLNIHDANIVATALLAGCSTLYSEDLQHGRRFETLSLANPFISQQ